MKYGSSYWNGTAWGADDSFRAAGFFHGTATAYPPGIQAVFPQNAFNPAFWITGNAVTCQLELHYDNTTAADPTASVSCTFTRNQPIAGGILLPQDLDPGPIPSPADADALLDRSSFHELETILLIPGI